MEHFSFPIKSRLDSMYRTENQLGKGNVLYPIDNCTRIGEVSGLDIYDICMNTNAKNTLEIGLAYGFSTLFFAEAYLTNKGTHTAIDPAQFSHWNGIGYTHATSILGSDFKFYSGTSYDVLPILKQQKKMYDVIFIDGNHRFDDAMTDFILSTFLCKVNGHIILDDTLMPSISRVCEFIKNNRHDYENVPLKSTNLQAFKKITDFDSRKWDYHVDF